MIRITAIWVCGLLGAGIVGGLIGGALWGVETESWLGGEFAGFLAGAFLFACLRLWFAPPSKNSN